jgi:glyoxylase-like metal-dependent hydrolase (beta-lactamase superfamily II)
MTGLQGSSSIPPPRQIAEHTWTIKVPGSGPGVNGTNSYLVGGAGGDVLIDPGWDAPISIAALEQSLWVIGRGFSSLRGILATHSHPDHAGSAGRIRAESGAWFAMGLGEPVPELRSPTDESTDLDQFDVWGAPADAVDDVLNDALSQIPRHIAPPDIRLSNGESIDGIPFLSAVLTPGHSDGHLCFVDRAHLLLYAGDHVLPGIAPHVAVQPGRQFNPLGAYLASLRGLEEFDRFEVWPGHESGFSDLAGRREQLARRVETRSEEVLNVIASQAPRHVWDVARSLRWSHGWENMHGAHLRLALGQTASHIELLHSRGHRLKIATRIAEDRADRIRQRNQSW